MLKNGSVAPAAARDSATAGLSARGNPVNSTGATPTGATKMPLAAADIAVIERIETLTVESLTVTLIALVSDRTGYPQDMIQPDMDLEADLGIDSIKRLEIFGAMFEQLGINTDAFQDSDDAKEMETIDVDTLSSIGKMANFFKESADKWAEMLKNGGVAPAAAPDSLGVAGSTPSAVAQQQEAEAEEVQEFSPGSAALHAIGFVTSTRKPAAGVDGLKGDVERQEVVPVRSLLLDTGDATELQVSRYQVVKQRLSPPDQVDLGLMPGRIWVVTDDGKGVCDEVAKLLLAQGQKVVRLQFQWQLAKGVRKPLASVPDYVVPLCEADSIKALISSIETEEGKIGGFIHVGTAVGMIKSPVSAFHKNDYATVQAVFNFAKCLQPSLNAPDAGRTFFFVVSQHDGALGLTGQSAVVAAGLNGLTKTLNIEWEGTFCRSVDIDPKCSKELAAQIVLEELSDSATGLAEVGRGTKGERMTLALAQADTAAPAEAPRALPDEKSVFLVTGGARGITASCVIALAKQSSATFILLGRTDLNAPVPQWAIGVTDVASMKSAAIKQLQAEGELPTPVKIDRMLKVVLQCIEIKETLARIEQVGAKALYLTCDITKADDVTRVVADAETAVGRIDGIIHGAGNLFDNLIEKKSDADFLSVFHTKVKGLENVLKAVQPGTLRSLVLFSSVSGFFGNAGQADYAMANEVLNKFAYLFQAHNRDILLRTINWGPWDGGMVNATLKKAYADRGLVIIPIERGTEFFVNEFRINGGPQVIIGGDNYKPVANVKTLRGTVTVRREIKPELNHFLNDHVIDAHSVLPATMAISWMVKLCEDLLPGYHLENLVGFQVLKGVVFNSREPVTLYAELQPTTGEQKGVRHEIAVRIFTRSAAAEHNRYRAVVTMSRKKPTKQQYLTAQFEAVPSLIGVGSSIYDDAQQAGLLFHGPAFQGIRTVLNADASRLTALCQLDTLPDTSSTADPSQFTAKSFNGFLADVYLQAALVWLMLKSEFGGLPYEIDTIEQFAVLSFNQAFYVSVEVRSLTAFVLTIDIYVHDEAGTLYARLSGVRCTISEELRRIVMVRAAAKSSGGSLMYDGVSGS